MKQLQRPAQTEFIECPMEIEYVRQELNELGFDASDRDIQWALKRESFSGLPYVLLYQIGYKKAAAVVVEHLVEVTE